MSATLPLPTRDDLRSAAPQLHRGAEGIWYAAQPREDISYLAEGNAVCFDLEEKSFWFTHRNACIAALARRFPPAGTIFDIGGGNGCVARALLEAGFETAVVEPGETGARNAARRGIPHVVCATLAAANFRAASLPAVGLFDVLEHVEDDAAFLAELERCLQPGGRLYLTVPACNGLWSDDDVVAGHWRRHTLGGLSARLEQAGFRTLFRSYFFCLLPLPIFLLRSLPSLFGRRSLPRRTYAPLHEPRARFVTDRVWAWERRRLERGATIPFGSSCLVVAEKVANP